MGTTPMGITLIEVCGDALQRRLAVTIASRHHRDRGPFERAMERTLRAWGQRPPV
jgi:hypothetical protein